MSSNCWGLDTNALQGGWHPLAEASRGKIKACHKQVAGLMPRSRASMIKAVDAEFPYQLFRSLNNRKDGVSFMGCSTEWFWVS